VTQDVAQGGQACPSDSPQSQNCNMAACQPQVESERDAVTPIVTQIVTSRGNPDLPAHTTYVCSLQLKGDAINLHTIYGSKASPMLIPAAYQTPPPFGVDTGGVHDSFFALPACGIGVSDTGEQGQGCQRDSWLTVGITRGNDENFLGDVGIDWDSWTAELGATVDDGAVFWLSKDDGPNPNDVNGKVTLKGEGSAGLIGEDSAPLHSIVVAQITIPEGSQATLRLSAQGRKTMPAGDGGDAVGDDWQEEGIAFNLGGSPLSATCSEELAELAEPINFVCCSAESAGCSEDRTIPQYCTKECAVIFLSFYNRCSTWLFQEMRDVADFGRQCQVCTHTHLVLYL
jgi:hypothetical protein